MDTIKIIEQIFAAFGALGWLELFGAFVVAIGCAGELWILANKLTRRIEPIGKTASRFWRSMAWIDVKIRPLLLMLKINGRKLSEPKEQLLERFFVLLVAFGVTIEFICLPFSMSKIADLNTEAGKARLEAGQAIERAALTESNNLVLRTNLLTLEQQISKKLSVFRQLSHETTNWISEKIKSFDPIKVRIECASDLAETTQFAAQICRIFPYAKGSFRGTRGPEPSVSESEVGKHGDITGINFEFKDPQLLRKFREIKNKIDDEIGQGVTPDVLNTNLDVDLVIIVGRRAL